MKNAIKFATVSATLKRYKRLAKFAGVTLDEISKVTGLHVSQISRTLNGKVARGIHEETIIAAIKQLVKIRSQILK
jgi:transcriptional regulator with XRE-family HTH domain